MIHFCRPCQRTFPTTRGFMSHQRALHLHPKPNIHASTVRSHPKLNGKSSEFGCSDTFNELHTAVPCDRAGTFLDPNSAPPLRDDSHDWGSFGNRFRFEFAQLTYERIQASKSHVDDILRLWAAHNTAFNNGSAPVAMNQGEVECMIDECTHGECPWEMLTFKYAGPITSRSPRWKQQEFVVYTRNALAVLESMAASSDFDGKWDYTPFKEYVQENMDRRYSHVMSGRWAWRQAVSSSKAPVVSVLTRCPKGQNRKGRQDARVHAPAIHSWRRQNYSLSRDRTHPIPSPLHLCGEHTQRHATCAP
jgi:hypothetical protein